MSLQRRLTRLERHPALASTGGVLEIHLPVEWKEFATDHSITPCPRHGARCRVTEHPTPHPGRFARIYALEPDVA